MADFKDIERLLETAAVAGPANEDLICSAEAELGVKFPPSYRQFLCRFGAAQGKGWELAGLFQNEGGDDEPPRWSDIITDTLQRRRYSIPNEYLPVSDDGGDYTFYLDTGQAGSKGECPVVVLGPGADAVKVAEDYFDFVVRLAENRLSF